MNSPATPQEVKDAIERAEHAALVDLWKRVLEQSIQDALGGPAAFERCPCPEDVTAAAWAWILDDEPGELRFRWVCDVVGLDYLAVRAGVLRRVKS